jgi:phospholipid-translocating ATPase
MSFLKRHHVESDDEELEGIDPELRLRTVRTAHSAIAESIVADDRKTRRRRKSRFWRGRAASEKRQQESTTPSDVQGVRRNVYVNTPLAPHEVDSSGDPRVRYPRNKVRTTSECFLGLVGHFRGWPCADYVPGQERTMWPQFGDRLWACVNFAMSAYRA